MEAQSYLFSSCQKVLYGWGCLASLPQHLQRVGAQKFLLVSDAMVQKLGHVERLSSLLAEAGLSSVPYTEVNSEPEDLHVERGVAIAKEHGCQAVIAIGGGSCLDAAKGIAIMCANPGQISDYEGRNIQLPVPKLPLVLIATTAGTGSEVSNSTIITDTKRVSKMIIKSDSVRADLAVCDASLTESMPPSVTAATGLDALAHAIEGFLSSSNQPLGNILALDAIRLIYHSLPLAYDDPHHQEARSNMMLGQVMAGMVMGNASTASMHGMARPVGAFFHVPHGLGVAMFMPAVMSYTLPAVPAKFRQIAEAIGLPVQGLDDLAAGKLAVTAFQQLCARLHVPTLREFGIEKEAFLAVLPQMLEDKSAINTHKLNPRAPGCEDCEQIYLQMIDK